MQNDHLKSVFIHSSRSLRNLVAISGEYWTRISNVLLIAGSERIAETAEELSWQGPISIAESPSNKHMMIAFSRV